MGVGRIFLDPMSEHRRGGSPKKLITNTHIVAQGLIALSVLQRAGTRAHASISK